MSYCSEFLLEQNEEMNKIDGGGGIEQSKRHLVGKTIISETGVSVEEDNLPSFRKLFLKDCQS